MGVGVDVSDGLADPPVVSGLCPDPFLYPCSAIGSGLMEEQASPSTVPEVLGIYCGHSETVELIDGIFVSIVIW